RGGESRYRTATAFRSFAATRSAQRLRRRVCRGRRVLDPGGRFARQAVAVIPEVNRWATSRTDVVQRGLKAPLSADYRKELCKMQQLGRTLTTQSLHKRNHFIAPAPGTSPVVEQTE